MLVAAGFKKAYQILTWTSLAGLVLILALMLKKAPAPDVPNDPQAAVRAEQKFAAADEAKSAGQPAQVALDRTELNSYLSQNLQLESSTGLPIGTAPTGATAGAGSAAAGNSSEEQPTLEEVQSSVKDVKVDMAGDVVKAYVVFDFHGKDMTLELDGHLSTEGGYIRFEPISGMLGSLPLPKSVLNSAVDKLIASPENREKLRLPSDVSDIKIVDGEAVMTYK